MRNIWFRTFVSCAKVGIFCAFRKLLAGNFLCFSTEQVTQCGYGMIEYHAWSGPSHDFTYAFSHGAGIAVDGAMFACGLSVAVSAVVELAEGVVDESFTFGAKLAISFFPTTVKANHDGYGLLLLCYGSHGRWVMIELKIRCKPFADLHLIILSSVSLVAYFSLV